VRRFRSLFAAVPFCLWHNTHGLFNLRAEINRERERVARANDDS
jgi:hypothetical protein